MRARLSIGMAFLLAATTSSGCVRSGAVEFERLSLGSVCYGMCAYVLPLRLPRVTVYEDGRVLTTKVQTQGSFRTILLEGRVSREAMKRLQELTHAADLPDDETQADFEGVEGFADGGGSIFSGVAKKPFRVEAPHLSDGTGMTDRRKALLSLKKELESAGQSASTPVPAPRSALVAYRRAQAGGQPWRGPSLAGLPADWQGRRCVVLQGKALDRVAAAVRYEGFGTLVTEAREGFTVLLRPLLPHESTCEDILTP